MRRTKALVALGFMLLTPMPMGASITMPVLAPGVGKLVGAGTWGVANNETFGSMYFQTTLKGSNPAQTTQAMTTRFGATWSSTLVLVKDTYNPTTVTLYYSDANANPSAVSVSDMNDRAVK